MKNKNLCEVEGKITGYPALKVNIDEALPENHYFIRYAGNKPFIVVVGKPYLTLFVEHEEEKFSYSTYEGEKHVNVYQKSNQKEGDFTIYDHLLTYINYKSIFIPGSDDNPNEHPGNNILIERIDKNYVLVDEGIVGFSTDDPIVKFTSVVNENDISRPYAIDSMDRYYLLWVGVLLESIPEEEKKDPASYWAKESIRYKSGLIKNGKPFDLNLNVHSDKDILEFHEFLEREREDLADAGRYQKAVEEIKRRRDNNELKSTNPGDYITTVFVLEKKSNDSMDINDILTQPVINAALNPDMEVNENVVIEMAGEQLRLLNENYNTVEINVLLSEYDEIISSIQAEIYELDSEDIYIKNEETTHWELVNFAKYREMQDNWRKKLKCRCIKGNGIISKHST